MSASTTGNGEQEQRTAASVERSAARRAAKVSASATEGAGRPEAQAESHPTAGAAAVPAQAHPGAGINEAEVPKPPKPKMFPYLDGVEAAGHLISKMPSTEFAKMLAVLNEHAEVQAVSAR
ncbi:hypothetical protein ACFWHQ_38260 [Streptomyces sp. NPDC060334]|uniref:hypothetical protein n=1 Tax=Streptomyces sp. NPDC060334 TaxID=3347099 RepID=UPI003646206B